MAIYGKEKRGKALQGEIKPLNGAGIEQLFYYGSDDVEENDVIGGSKRKIIQ